ncbi:hypothetical protein C942_03443 [Photobacterium marinum]|uniref:Polysaccharide biosynthesis protein n=1 Tax=Photobacterium marinum TaxID=1056511 RepID=L8J8B9_9GAMM|nr:hypothetical protein [Photobacterium marinum]ELR63774.1 hypothetical protein C942_03443 [Photobacterium marinum]
MISSILRVLTGDLIAKLASFVSFLILTWSQSEENVALFVIANSIIAICLDPSATFSIQKIVNDGLEEKYRITVLRYIFFVGNILSFILVFSYSAFDSIELKISIAIFIFLTSSFIYRRVYWQSLNVFEKVSKETVYRYLFVLFGSMTVFFLSNFFEIKSEVLFLCVSIFMAAFLLFNRGDSAFEIKKLSGFKLYFSKADLKIVLYLLILSVWGQIDIIYSSAAMVEYDTVVMATALRFYSIFVLVISSINTVVLPSINKIDSEDSVRGLFLIISFFIICLLLAIIISPFIFPILTNNNYPESILCFQILSLSLITSFFAIRSFNKLLASGKHVDVIVIFLFAVIIKTCTLIVAPSLYNIKPVYILSISTLISTTILNILVIIVNKTHENSTAIV